MILELGFIVVDLKSMLLRLFADTPVVPVRMLIDRSMILIHYHYSCSYHR